MQSLMLLVAVIVAGGCGIHASPPTAEEMSGDVERLELVLPALRDEGVRYFLDLDWCHGLANARGAFSDRTDANGCLAFAGAIAEFDEEAKSGFTSIKDLLATTGLAVRTVETWPRPCGTEWQFHLDAGDFDRFAYVYCPNQAVPKSSADSVYTPIDANWYFWNEDWN
jgi:hypothetical protein